MINKEEYNKNGYVVLKKVFDPRFIDQLRARYTSVFAKLVKTTNNSVYLDDFALFDLFEKKTAGFKNCGLVIQNMLETYQLMLSPEIMLNVNQLLADASIATRPVIHTSHPKLEVSEGYWQTPPHQDQASVQQSLNTVVCFIPLVDHTKELGPLKVWEGSHLDGKKWLNFNGYFGEVFIGDLDLDNEKEIPMSKGDVLLFNSSLSHASGENVSNSIRWSISFRYTDLESADWLQRDLFSPYVYKPIIDDNYSYSAEDIKRALDG